ncbi:MAG: tetratricopeptide repeat protein, partial [bacterium]
MLLASRGDEQQEQQARDILGELIDADDAETSDDALRYLIILDQKVWKMSSSTGNTPRSRELSLEIQHRFDQLTKRRSPAPMDLVQYVEFLLLSEKTEDVPLLLERLESAMGITPQTLALRIRLAHLKNETDRIREIIVQSITGENEREVSARIIALSEMLAQSGLKEESIQLLHAAYEKSPVHLRALVDRLMNQGDFQKGLDVCLERAKIDNSPELTSLIADSWTGRGEWDSKAETLDFILERGLMNHPNDATVLESVGSLRLSQFRYEEAFRLLEAANRISPDSLLTLNNLAIAAYEMPGRQVFARAMIERAISKYGRIP